MASKTSDTATKAKTSPTPAKMETGDSAGSTKPSTNRLLIAGLVSGVIILETLVFFFMVPSGEEVAALAERRLIEKTVSAKIAADHGSHASGSHTDAHGSSTGGHGAPSGSHGSSHGTDTPQKDENRIIEQDLGTFNIAFIPAGTDLPYRVEFRLFGELVAKSQLHLEDLMAEKSGRFRNRLILEIRNASLEELQENQLGLIRRRILATSTEVLGEPILLNVGFHDYQVIED